MSGAGPASPNSSFQARLNRVNERRAPIEAARPQVDVLPDWRENVRYPATLVGMAFLGMFAVFFARFARFHLMGGTLSGDSPDVTMIIDAGLAGLAAFLVFMAIGLTARDENRAERGGLFSVDSLKENPVKAAAVVGIIIMMSTMHNMVHSMPGVFGVLFSDEWAEDVVAYSEPGSLYYRGNYYVVMPQAEEVAEQVVAPVEEIAPEPEAPVVDEVAPEPEPEKKPLPKVRRL